MNIDRKIMEVNYFSHVALTKTVLPIMDNQKGGHIITISSLSGKFGFFLRSAYAASKHALQGFFESLRLEEEANGLKVLLVFPGLIRTNISVNAINAAGKTHGKMDNNQANGISAEKCAAQIITGLQKGKLEIFPGGKETKAVKVKRFSPKLFNKLIKKRSGV
jgi:dehydrogenase/reductase SDR family protein 7B